MLVLKNDTIFLAEYELVNEMVEELKQQKNENVEKLMRIADKVIGTLKQDNGIGMFK